MPKREPRMVALGYGKWVRADRVFAVVPLEPGERGEGRRTYVHVDGISAPLVASRSERAILTDVEAALTEPLACCLRAQQQMHIGADDLVVIVGAGSIGLLHVRLARACGVSSCILVEVDPVRRAQAGRLTDALIVSPQESAEAVRALNAGRGADVVIVAAGTVTAEELGVRLVGKGGRLNFFAGLPPSSPALTLESNRLHYDEVTLSGSHGSAPSDNGAALALLASGVVRVHDLITHVLPLGDICEAVALLERGAALKVVLQP